MLQHNAVAEIAMMEVGHPEGTAGLHSISNGTNPSAVTVAAMINCNGQRSCWDLDDYTESHS